MSGFFDFILCDKINIFFSVIATILLVVLIMLISMLIKENRKMRKNKYEGVSCKPSENTESAQEKPISNVPNQENSIDEIHIISIEKYNTEGLACNNEASSFVAEQSPVFTSDLNQENSNNLSEDTIKETELLNEETPIITDEENQI